MSVKADDNLTISDMTTALCLYRVVQEACEHRETRRARMFEVTLRRLEDEVQTTVVDDGKGFDLAKARAQDGLGLRSIEERVRLVGGRLSIETAPHKGQLSQSG